MDTPQIFVTGGFGGLAIDGVTQAGHVHKVLQAALGFRIFRQPPGGQRLHQPTDGNHPGIIAAGMPKTLFVPIESRLFHFLFPAQSYHEHMPMKFSIRRRPSGVS